MDERDLVESFSRWERLELEHAARLRELASRASSPLVKAVLTAVAMDSEKHAELYRIARQAVVPGPLAADEFEASLSQVGQHIDTEVEAVKFLESLANGGVNPQLEFVLKLILRDEKFHHILLYDLYQALVRGKVLGEGEEWRELYEALDRFI